MTSIPEAPYFSHISLLQLWIQPSGTKSTAPSSSFLGFYVPYPDPERHPPPLGLVSFVPTTPPMLNWIYVSLPSRELRYGNRTASISHTVGPWAWDSGEDIGTEVDGSYAGDNGGGLTLGGREGCVAVETDSGWQLFWEDSDGKIPDLDGKKRRRLQVSVERVFAEDVEDAGAGVKVEEKEKTKQEDGGRKEKKVGKMQGGYEVHGEKGQKKEERRTEATLEVRTKTVEEGAEAKEKKEEKTRYEYR